MSDRLLQVSWKAPVRGREDRALEIFDSFLGMLGRMQQDGRIESFDVVIMRPNADINGYTSIRGSAAQIANLKEDREFLANTADAALIVEDLRQTEGYTGEGVAMIMSLYREAMNRIPQLTT